MYIILKHFGDKDFKAVPDYDKTMFSTDSLKEARDRLENLKKGLQQGSTLIKYKLYKLSSLTK